MMPPQVRPTAKASSSLMPYRCRPGSPVSTASCDASYTAPSTQPPETLPTAVPSGPTSIDAPAGRGAERQVATTVPMPTGSPASHHRTRSSSTSRTRDHPYQFFQSAETVPGDEVVQVRQRRRHAAGQRRVPGLALVRVHPDHPVRQPAEPAHLFGEYVGVAAFPAVAEHHDDRAPGHAALPPAVQERLDRLAQPGAAGPVRDRASAGDQDRKSTRLHSSHITISYAVFCWKKKKQRPV